jgi:hypothetical protein
LRELPAATSFTVLVPEHPPFPLESVALHPSDRRFGVSEQVHIGYASDFFGEEDRQFWLVESADRFPERRAVKWSEAGSLRFGEDHDIDPPLRLVQLQRLGTQVELPSYHLDVDELLHLARALVPLPGGPPILIPPAP